MNSGYQPSMGFTSSEITIDGGDCTYEILRALVACSSSTKRRLHEYEGEAVGVSTVKQVDLQTTSTHVPALNGYVHETRVEAREVFPEHTVVQGIDGELTIDGGTIFDMEDDDAVDASPRTEKEGEDTVDASSRGGEDDVVGTSRATIRNRPPYTFMFSENRRFIVSSTNEERSWNLPFHRIVPLIWYYARAGAGHRVLRAPGSTGIDSESGVFGTLLSLIEAAPTTLDVEFSLTWTAENSRWKNVRTFALVIRSFSAELPAPRRSPSPPRVHVTSAGRIMVSRECADGSFADERDCTADVLVRWGEFVGARGGVSEEGIQTKDDNVNYRRFSSSLLKDPASPAEEIRLNLVLEPTTLELVTDDSICWWNVEQTLHPLLAASHSLTYEEIPPAWVPASPAAEASTVFYRVDVTRSGYITIAPVGDNYRYAITDAQIGEVVSDAVARWSTGTHLFAWTPTHIVDPQESPRSPLEVHVARTVSQEDLPEWVEIIDLDTDEVVEVVPGVQMDPEWISWDVRYAL